MWLTFYVFETSDSHMIITSLQLGETQTNEVTCARAPCDRFQSGTFPLHIVGTQ